MNRRQIELFILSILAIASIAVLVLRIIFIQSYLPETGGVSINVIYGIEQLLNTGKLYLNPEQPPFSIIQYMPLHYHLIAWTARLLNVNDVHQVMMLNRFAGLLFDIISTCLIISCIKKIFHGVGSRVSFSAGFLYFLLIPGIVFARVDNLYLLLWIFTITNILRFIILYEQKKSIQFSNLLILSVSSSLALLSKQTSVFLIIFIAGFLLLAVKDRKYFFQYSISTALITSALLFLINDSAINDFKLNVIDGLKNGINLNWFLEVFIKNYFIKYAVLICTGIFTGLQLLHTKKSLTHIFLGSGIIFYFLIAVFFSLKGGSGPNYYLEFNVLSILGLCLLIQTQPLIPAMQFGFAAIVIPFLLLACMNDKGWAYLSCRKKAEADYKNCKEVSAYVKSKLDRNNYVLTAFHKENCLNLLLTPHALFPCREVALYFTYPNGVFTFHKFNDLLNSGRVQFYIDEKGSLPSEFLNEKLDTFIPDTTIGNYIVYKI